MIPVAIDHKTCGHVNHTTIDASRHEEIHTAMLTFMSRWYSQANHARAAGNEAVALAYEAVIDDFAESMRGFEVEQ
jgi:hypothetical protein